MGSRGICGRAGYLSGGKRVADNLYIIACASSYMGFGEIFLSQQSLDRMRELHNLFYETESSIEKIFRKTTNFLVKSEEVYAKDVPWIAEAFRDTEYENLVRFFVRHIWCFILIPKPNSEGAFIAISIERKNTT